MPENVTSPVKPSPVTRCSPAGNPTSQCSTQQTLAPRIALIPLPQGTVPDLKIKSAKPKKSLGWKNYARGGLAMVGGIAAWEIYYHGDKGRGLGDWFGKFQRKNFRGIGFDNNDLFTNRIGHLTSGLGYYWACKELGDLDHLVSAGCTVVGSTAFEVGGEDGIPALNDEFYTPIAGTALGATMHLFIRHAFKKESNSRSNGLLDTPLSNPTRRFEVSIQGQRLNSRRGGAETSTDLLSVGFKGEVNAIPGHGREGRRKGYVSGKKADLFLEATADDEGFSDLDIRAQAALLGYFWNDLGQSASGLLSGYTFYLGAATALDYRQHLNRPERPRDHLGAAGLGASVDFSWYQSDGLKLRARADLLADFSMSTSHAFAKWTQKNSTDDIKPVLRTHGYYFGLSPTARAQVTANYQDYELGVQGEHQRIDSIEGFSREQDKVGNDVNVIDTRTRGRLWLSRNYGNFKVSGEVEGYRRGGKVESIAVKSKGLKGGVKLGYSF